MENTAEETLAFYKERLSHLEQEHEDYLERISLVEPKQEELHKQRYKIREQTAQIAQLQKGLSDANVNVDVEREEAAHLRAEVQILRAEQVEDRKRMQQLLALTALREDGSANPGEEMTAFFPGGRDRKKKSKAAGAGRGGAGTGAGNTTVGLTGGGRGGSVVGGGGGGAATPAAAGSSMQPQSSQAERSLGAALGGLGKDHEDYKQVARERIAALYEDRAAREEQAARMLSDQAALLVATEARLAKAEEQLLSTTKDYLALRHSAQVAQRQAVDERDALRRAREALDSERVELVDKSRAEMEAVRRAAADEVNLKVSGYLTQLREREGDLLVVKEQYAAVQSLYQQRLADLKRKLAKANQQTKAAMSRRRLEVEGFANDTRKLRDEMASMERRVGASSGGLAHMASQSHYEVVDIPRLEREIARLRGRLETALSGAPEPPLPFDHQRPHTAKDFDVPASDGPLRRSG